MKIKIPKKQMIKHKLTQHKKMKIKIIIIDI